LTPIYVPDEEDEAVRDLVRARHSAVIDQRKARQRLKGPAAPGCAHERPSVVLVPDRFRDTLWPKV
jgi:hypothetical protein